MDSSISEGNTQEKQSAHEPASTPIWNSTKVLSLVIALIAILLVPTLLRRLPIGASRLVATSAISTRAATTLSTATEMSTKSSAAEERMWNSSVSVIDVIKERRADQRLADRMDVFHNHFRYEFDRVYKLCDGGFQKEGMSLPRFIRQAKELHDHLHMHHTIETYIFPVLSKRMPQFKAGARESGEHLKSHKAIHDGLTKYDDYLSSCLANPSSYSPQTLREIMDGFREILFRHLDEEVHDLGAESMKAAGWTLAELKRIPM